MSSRKTYDPEEILGRKEQEVELVSLGAQLAGKRVLITGAAGTIGSALSRAVAASAPESLVAYDHDEYGLYTLRGTLDELQPNLQRRVVLGDVRDKARLDQVFKIEKPEIVFHVAALKHVGMVEENPAEGAATNVLGTRNTSDVARKYGAQAMVLISTDKAVRPHNMMGATKKIAEELCRARDMDSQSPTRHIIVRFGNVFGSSGSVVPLFAHQIERLLPVTITHPEVERYFMTEREAVSLVLEALQIGLEDEGSRGSIFFHDMGPGVRIADLARRMITSQGLRPNVDIPIVITKLRAGEKISEALLAPGETAEATRSKQVALARGKIDRNQVTLTLNGLDAACRLSDEIAVRRMLSNYIHSDAKAPEQIRAKVPAKDAARALDGRKS
ncbi:MAG: polysaccharide biosynthesis protein [Robiginitomaculum sp.]|nr:polysaccharide biosynthesis protein [Robiginitomaculum sp.]MDQ7077409.1 polysaccharide biosynthesis protein [Robiginitomaculum sp.]